MVMHLTFLSLVFIIIVTILVIPTSFERGERVWEAIWLVYNLTQQLCTLVVLFILYATIKPRNIEDGDRSIEGSNSRRESTFYSALLVIKRQQCLSQLVIQRKKQERMDNFKC